MTKTTTKNNLGVIKTIYGKDNPLVKNVTDFSVIRTRGDKNSAITHDGHRVERKESLYLDEFGLVQCAQYETHFCYVDPAKKIGRWTLMCTCGSPSGLVGSNSPINKLMTPTKGSFTLVCLTHTTSKDKVGIGRHADGSTE